MIWLRITPDNRISEHRHCVRRQPHEQIMAISCERWVTGHWSAAPYHLAACPSRYAKL
ncbi:hypothetical protein DEU38_123103 [Rhodococcus sp. AG1013]|nr:hypothetical protein DEU38_123103 [Rhodococcus sp. AG1013]